MFSAVQANQGRPARDDATRAVAAEHARQPDHYLTDGVNLYRSLGALAGAMGQMVALEDCRSLDVVQLPIGQLHASGLRVVITAEERSGRALAARRRIRRP